MTAMALHQIGVKYIEGRRRMGSGRKGVKGESRDDVIDVDSQAQLFRGGCKLFLSLRSL